jgi:hypothetical protein
VVLRRTCHHPIPLRVTKRLRPLVGEANYSDTLLLFGTARARLGYAFDGWMAYGTGGFAWAYDTLTRTQSVGTPFGGSASGGTNEGAFLWRLGWAAECRHRNILTEIPVLTSLAKSASDRVSRSTL